MRHAAIIRQLLTLLLALLPMAGQAEPIRLVLIIDDLGNHMARDLRALKLPGKLNLAILPHTPNASHIANMAGAANKEVMLHAPMSAVRNEHLGPGALTAEMSEQVFRATLAASLQATPHVRGVSNHMGSALTEQTEPMRWLMDELVQRDLYFVDSRTSAGTVAATVARQYRIPVLSRQVFLDNDASPAAIAIQFEQFLRRGREEGLAVAIGHPYPTTLDFLQRVLPQLEEQGYELVWVSEALSKQRYHYSQLEQRDKNRLR